MSNWEIMLDYFTDGLIPYSEYLWMVAILGVSIYALLKARKMVSEI